MTKKKTKKKNTFFKRNIGYNTTQCPLLVDSHANYLCINPAQHDETQQKEKKRKNFLVYLLLFFFFLAAAACLPVTCSDKIKAVHI